MTKFASSTLLSTAQKTLFSTSAAAFVLAFTKGLPRYPVNLDFSAFAPSWLPQSLLDRLQNLDLEALVAISGPRAGLDVVQRYPPLVPYPNPVYGNTREYSEKPKEFLDSAFAKYGPVFRASILGRDQVILDHDHAHLLFNLLGKGLDHEQGVIDAGVQLVHQHMFKEVLAKLDAKKSIEVTNPFNLCKKCLADAVASVIVGVELSNAKDIAWVFPNVSEAVAEVSGLGGHGSLLATLIP
ncbi:hypothetical protein B0H14DRAFT_3854121 [Mycena olivaceomarginata]|nr:hypothetical protein B0H14DRAFT_3854121 [Mycena olivaceomarginata]